MKINEVTDIQYPEYNDEELDLRNALDGNVDWHVAIKLIKEIMDANDIILGDLE